MNVKDAAVILNNMRKDLAAYDLISDEELEALLLAIRVLNEWGG